MNKSVLNWELMWKFIVLFLIGVFLLLIGVFNFYGWNMQVRIGAAIVGVILVIFGLWRIKDKYKNI